MLTSSVQSAPCATPEAANDMVGGLLLQAGKGQKVEVLNTEVHEVDGLWIATAFFKIETAEEEEVLTEEDQRVLDDEEKRRQFAETDAAGAVYWHDIHREQYEGQEPAPSRAIPDEEGPPINAEDYRADTIGVVPPPEQVREARAQQEIEDERKQEQISEDASKLAEDLQKDFEQAEQAENADQVAYVSDDRVQDHEKTFEERREEEEAEQERREEEELERLRREAVPLNAAEIPLEGPEPKPAE